MLNTHTAAAVFSLHPVDGRAMEIPHHILCARHS